MGFEEIQELVNKNVLVPYHDISEYIKRINVPSEDFPSDIFYEGDTNKAKVTSIHQKDNFLFPGKGYKLTFNAPVPDITKPYTIYTLQDDKIYAILYSSKDGAICLALEDDLKRVFDMMLGAYNNIKNNDNGSKGSNCKVTGIR